MTSTTSSDQSASLVEECYVSLLGREPDEAGLIDKARRLDSGEVALRDIITEIVTSEEFATRLPGFLSLSPKRADSRLTIDVSQYGEIWMLVRRWVNAQAGYGMVVDVGARGRERSNSYDLMRHFGWRGLLVEANPALLPAITRDFAGCDMQLVSCAISDFTGQAVFTLGSNDDVSSLDAAAAANWGETRGELTVTVRRLAGVLEEHAVPLDFDLLSLDIEGEDIKVFNDLVGASGYRPRWVIIEASDDFRVRTLDDAPFSDAVRNAYTVVMATRSNLILGRRNLERDAWLAMSTA